MHSLFVLFALFTLEPDTPEFNAVITRGLEEIYHLKFDRADACFDSLIIAAPGHPAGYYFKATSCFYQIISCSNPLITEKVFMDWNDRTIAVAEVQADPMINDFYRGTAYGNIARYHVVNGDFLRAFYYARKSKSLHEDILKRDPENYDAYLTVGVYNYYASALPQWMGLVAGLLGLGGDRDKGIEQLETAFHKGRIAGIEASFVLANVYYEEGNYEKSLDYYDRLIRRFPDNYFLHNQKGVLLFSMEHFSEAKSVFLNAYDMAPARMPASRLFSAYYLGRIYKLENNYPKAIDFFEEAVALSEKQKLFKSINAWLPGSAEYQCGECYELAGDRPTAESHYRAAREHPLSTKSIVQAATNRKAFKLSVFETEVMRARHLVLFGRTDEGYQLLERLQPKATGDYERFLAQINYYMGRVLFKREAFDSALEAFKKALEEISSDEDWRRPSATFYSGLCYLKLGEKEPARRAFKEVLKSDGYTDSARLHFRSKSYLSGL